jgi:hypothetical protein
MIDTQDVKQHAALIMAALLHRQRVHPEMPNEELAAVACDAAEALAVELEHRRRHRAEPEPLADAPPSPLAELAERLFDRAVGTEPPARPRCKCEPCEVEECEDRQEVLPPEPPELGPYPRLCPGCAHRAPRVCPYRELLSDGRYTCVAAGVKTFNPTWRCMDCPAALCVDCRNTRVEVHAVE